MLGRLFKRDTLSIAKIFKKLQNEATLDKEEVTQLLRVPGSTIEHGGEVELNGNYVVDAEGNIKFTGNFSLNPSDLADAVAGNSDFDANIDAGRTVEVDGNRTAKVKVWVKSTYTAPDAIPEG